MGELTNALAAMAANPTGASLIIGGVLVGLLIGTSLCGFAIRRGKNVSLGIRFGKTQIGFIAEEPPALKKPD